MNLRTDKLCQSCCHKSVCPREFTMCDHYLDLNELLTDIVAVEKERDYWHNLCQSYEQTIVKLTEAISQKGKT